MNPHEFLFILKMTAIVFIPIAIGAMIMFAIVNNEYREDNK